MSATPNDNTVEATGSIFMRKLNQKGSVLIFLTIGFALLATFVGFALDFGRGYLEKARIARLIDGASLAAAKALKGQSGLENQATRAACDSMQMNGAAVIFTGGNTCVENTGAPLKVTVEYFDVPVKGGPAMRHVRITATKPVPTTFLNFLGWLVPGDYSTLNVVARAEAGPERPVDLMLVLDRSGSMTPAKMTAMKTTVNEFLSNNFSGDDRIGMISFGTRGCGNGSGGDSTTSGACTPDLSMMDATSANISTIKTRVSGLDALGGTNTMEALRTARAPMAAAFNDATRATTRKAVLLVTDGQPTFLTRDDSIKCEQRLDYPVTQLPPPFNDDGPNGCKMGVPKYTSTSRNRWLYRGPLTSGDAGLVSITSNGCTSALCRDLYLKTISCARSSSNDPGCSTKGAMHEANQIRNCGYGNGACAANGAHDVLVFAILIGTVTPNDPQSSADRNAKCLLSRIANATEVLNTGDNSKEHLTTVCRSPADTTIDGDTHADLQEGWPCAVGPCIDTTQEKGKVYIVDQNGDIQAQLQQVFTEIAAILKLRLTL
jgi:hypothetical protein